MSNLGVSKHTKVRFLLRRALSFLPLFCSRSLCFHVFLLAVRAPPWERTCECAIKRMITCCRNTRVCSHLFGCFCDLSNTGVLLYLILMYSTYCSSGVGPTGFLIAVFQRSGVPANSPFVLQHLDAGLVAHCAAPPSTCFQRLCTHIDVAHRSTILAQRVRLFFF